MTNKFNENGFSLVELAVAAAVAIALATVTINVLHGTADNAQSSGQVAKQMEECNIHNALAPWGDVLSC